MVDSASATLSKDGEMNETSTAQQTACRDNRSLFIEAMGDSTRRRIAFDVVARNCRMRFRVGESGIRAYLEILELVQLSKLDEAVDDFEKRFLPMLDQKLLKSMFEESPPESEAETLCAQ